MVDGLSSGLAVVHVHVKSLHARVLPLPDQALDLRSVEVLEVDSE
jgi:hypothetical protein